MVATSSFGAWDLCLQQQQPQPQLLLLQQQQQQQILVSTYLLTMIRHLFVVLSGFERNIFLEKLLHSKAAADKESFKSSDCVLNERDENDLVFGIMTTVGYWFITIVLMTGLILGERPRMTVIIKMNHNSSLIPLYIKILLFNIFGFLFFLSMGSEQIARYRGRDVSKTNKLKFQ